VCRSVAERPCGGGWRHAGSRLSHPAVVLGRLQQFAHLLRTQQRAILRTAERRARRLARGPVTLRQHVARQQRPLSLRTARSHRTMARAAVGHCRQYVYSRRSSSCLVTHSFVVAVLPGTDLSSGSPVDTSTGKRSTGRLEERFLNLTLTPNPKFCCPVAYRPVGVSPHLSVQAFV